MSSSVARCIPDMVRGFYFCVILTTFEIAECAAETQERAVIPKSLPQHLHLNVYNCSIIEQNLDIEDERLVIYGLSRLYRI